MLQVETGGPDAIFVLGSGIAKRVVRNPKTGEVTTRLTTYGFNDSDTRGATAWGRVRLIAAASLANSHPASIIGILSRNMDNYGPYDEATLSAFELAGRYKVSNLLLINPHPIDTFSELLTITSTALYQNWRQVMVLTDGMKHVRGQAMLDSLMNIKNPTEAAKVQQMLEFNERRYPPEVYAFRGRDFDDFRRSFANLFINADRLTDVRVDLVISEDIASVSNPHYKYVIDVVKSDPRYQERLDQETRAAAQWQAGTYGLPQK